MRVKQNTLTTLHPSNCQYQIGNCQKPPILDRGMNIRDKVAFEVTRYEGGLSLLSANWRAALHPWSRSFSLEFQGSFLSLTFCFRNKKSGPTDHWPRNSADGISPLSASNMSRSSSRQFKMSVNSSDLAVKKEIGVFQILCRYKPHKISNPA